MKHMTLADLRAGLTAIGELTIKAKEAPIAAGIMARYEAEIADFGKPEKVAPVAEPVAVTPAAKTDLMALVKPANGEGHAPEQ